MCPRGDIFIETNLLQAFSASDYLKPIFFILPLKKLRVFCRLSASASCRMPFCHGNIKSPVWTTPLSKVPGSMSCRTSVTLGITLTQAQFSFYVSPHEQHLCHQFYLYSKKVYRQEKSS
jgi:hypothetical protein